MPRLTELRSALHELEAAHESWMREFCSMHSIHRFEDLAPMALEIDQAFSRSMEALESLPSGNRR